MGSEPWERRLPNGVHVSGRNQAGFTLGVPLPLGADGLLPLRCPTDREHLFKIRVAVADEGGGDLCCPYCGHQADIHEFMADQMPILDAAMEAAAEQYMHQTISQVIGRSFTGSFRPPASGFGVRVMFNPGTPPPRQALPTYEVEETRRTMRCEVCDEEFAVYGLTVYCPVCGRLAPRQQFAELVRTQQARLDALHDLDPEAQRQLAESGALAATYESTIKDGFSALETYLEARFSGSAAGLAKPPPSGVFQRLDDVNALYIEHLDLDLAAFAGPQRWDQLQRSAAIRHVLTHRSGIVDERFLARMPNWTQSVGQRIQVARADATDFLAVLVGFAATVGA